MSGPHPRVKTVLLVDDDASLRDLLREVLEEDGYRVIVAQNALEALQISQTFPDRLDLVIADIRMPLMSGVALAERLRKKRPVRLLLMSGAAPAKAPGGSRPVPEEAFIQKPFTPAELLAKVREVLGA